MTKVLLEEAKFRVKVDKEENLLICEANWEDPDNTEEWFCHLGKDLDEVVFQAIVFGALYTEDLRWLIEVDKAGSFIVYNNKYEVGCRIYRSALEEALTN